MNGTHAVPLLFLLEYVFIFFYQNTCLFLSEFCSLYNFSNCMPVIGNDWTILNQEEFGSLPLELEMKHFESPPLRYYSLEPHSLHHRVFFSLPGTYMQI